MAATIASTVPGGMVNATSQNNSTGDSARPRTLGSTGCTVTTPAGSPEATRHNHSRPCSAALSRIDPVTPEPAWTEWVIRSRACSCCTVLSMTFNPYRPCWCASNQNTTWECKTIRCPTPTLLQKERDQEDTIRRTWNVGSEVPNSNANCTGRCLLFAGCVAESRRCRLLEARLSKKCMAACNQMARRIPPRHRASTSRCCHSAKDNP